MSDDTMQLELETAFQQGYDRGQAEAFRFAFERICDVFSSEKRADELNNLYSMAKAGEMNEMQE